jgi:transposase
MDIHRTFAEVVIWEQGQLRRAGRADMTRSELEGFDKTLQASDEVVVEATGNTMALVLVLSPFEARVVIANPLQVRPIPQAQAHVMTDKIDAGVLATLHAAGCLLQVRKLSAETERLRPLVAHRNQEVRDRTRIKNEVHSILHAPLAPPCFLGNFSARRQTRHQLQQHHGVIFEIVVVKETLPRLDAHGFALQRRQCAHLV